MDQPSVSVKHAFTLPLGATLTLRGWVRSRRDSKGITFIAL
jgi:aspartyl/asparaginyl-tRNA synthetase